MRVVVIGGAIFAFAIESQADEATKIDFRAVPPQKLLHRPIVLPEDLVCRIRQLIELQGLVFGSMDFVFAKNGGFYFLENNINGQWLWLEELTGVRITDELVASFQIIRKYRAEFIGEWRNDIRSHLRAQLFDGEYNEGHSPKIRDNLRQILMWVNNN